MNILNVQILCLSLLLAQASSSDCNLLLFPSVLYFSDFLQAEHSIEPYIIDEYPQASADFTHPLQPQHTFSSINSEKFVEGYPFPLFVKAIEEEASVHFEMWNLTTGQLQNTSITYTLPKPSQCRYFSIQQLAYNDAFIHCQNATHHRHYSIGRLFYQEYSSIYELITSPNRENASKLLFYRILTDIRPFRLVRSNDKGIIQLYQYSINMGYAGQDFIEKQKDWVERQTGLASIEFIDYQTLNGRRGSFDIYLLRNEGILFAYEKGLAYDRWNLPGQQITKILGLVDTNIFAAITDSYLYFLSVWTHQKDQYRLVVKEIARIQLKDISFTEGFNIGEFIILAGNQAWNVFYLQEDNIKFFKFSTPLLLKDITIDGQFSNYFLFQNQQFLLRKPSLKISEATSSMITITSSKCQQILTIKRLSISQVEVVNENQKLVWRNGILQKNHTFCQGNNISSSLLTQGQIISIPKLKTLSSNLPSNITSIMNFTWITPDLSAIVTRVNFHVNILACYRNEPCQTIDHNYGQYDEKDHPPELINEARLNIFNVSLAKGLVYQSAPDLEKQLFLAIVWNMSKFYFTTFKILYNTIKPIKGSQFIPFKFIDFEVIGYSPAKKEECTANSDLVVNLVGYVVQGTTNNWSHYRYFGNGVDMTLRWDILFGFKRMCSTSNSNMKFLLYEYEGRSLKLKLIYDKEGFYYEIGFASFDNLLSKRAICSRLGLAVTNGSQIIFISDDLVPTRTLKLSSSTQDDKMSGGLLLHSKDASTTQIYNAETGFLIQSLHIPLEQIIVTKQSNSLALKNGTILHFDDTGSIPLVQPEDLALLTCSSAHSSVSKIKKIRIINDLSLPDAIQLQFWGRIDKNIWNATIRSLKGVTSLSKTQNLTHFASKVMSHMLQISDFADSNLYYRQIFGQTLLIIMYSAYCQRETGFPSYDSYAYIAYGNDFSWEKTIYTTIGLTNLYENNMSIASYNESAINFMNLQFDEKNLSNVQFSFNSCPVGVWIEDQFYLTRRIFRDSNHVYLMRYQIELWNSTYHISNSLWGADMPRRFVVNKPKIQIFTLEGNGGCKIQEITSESMGIDDEIKDFTIFVRGDTTYVFILTNSQIIAFKTLNQTSRLSAKLNRHYMKIDVRFDMLLLVSEQDNSQVYKIIWEAFPFAGTLELNFTLVHVQDSSEIIGGVVMEKGVIIASKLNLILYIFETKSTLYSIETRAVKEFWIDYQWTYIDAIQYKDSDTILLQYYYYFQRFNTVEVKVSFSLGTEAYEKLIVSNEQELKQYERKSVWKKAESKENLMTE